MKWNYTINPPMSERGVENTFLIGNEDSEMAVGANFVINDL